MCIYSNLEPVAVADQLLSMKNSGIKDSAYFVSRPAISLLRWGHMFRVNSWELRDVQLKGLLNTQMETSLYTWKAGLELKARIGGRCLHAEPTVRLKLWERLPSHSAWTQAWSHSILYYWELDITASRDWKKDNPPGAEKQWGGDEQIRISLRLSLGRERSHEDRASAGLADWTHG